MARMVSINGYVLGYRFFNPVFGKMLVMTSLYKGGLRGVKRLWEKL
jgi:hypothetical protein